MKHRIGKIISAPLALFTAAALCVACTPAESGKQDPPDLPPKEEYVAYDYTPVHTSTDRNIGFYSSDSSLNTVLNDFRERHMRDTENRIHTHPVGAGGTAWKEWEAMTGSWWDASAENGTMSRGYATKDLVKAWLLSPVQDGQGYIWRDEGGDIADWSMGWEFPDYRTGGKGWLFDEGEEGWTVSGGTPSVSSSHLNISAEGAEEIVLTSPEFSCMTAATPFLRTAFSWTPSAGDVEDLCLYYRTSDSPEWSEEHKVSFSEFCTRGFSIGGGGVRESGYFFPMYLLEDWGFTAGGYGARSITGVKFVLKGAAGKPLSGTLSFDYIATEYDDRQPLNNCNYLIAAQELLSFSQEEDTLQTVLPYARRAMNFLLDALEGREGLISTAYLAGHYNDGYKADGTGIGDGYWDVLAFPKVNLYCNISYYNAIEAMLYLEEMAKAHGLTASAERTKSAAMDGTVEYAETVESLLALKERCKERIQREFWNEKTGRFHVGIYDDGTGRPQDHGYLMFNEQVIESGIATEEQTASVMSWINGTRTVAGDDSRGEDIYRYEFAPRFNTGEIGSDFFFGYSALFDGNVQNGGTALHLAYYDLVAQAAVGKDALSLRLNAFRDWYLKVLSAGGQGMDFYRTYYSGSGIGLQGGGTGGTVGLDYEFLEAALLLRAVPEAIFSLRATADGTLCVSPALPKEYDYFRLENVTFAGHWLDVTVGQYFACISGLEEFRAGSGLSGKSVSFTFPKPSFDFEIYLDGVRTEDYRTQDGLVTVTLPLRNGKVEIKPAAVQ